MDLPANGPPGAGQAQLHRPFLSRHVYTEPFHPVNKHAGTWSDQIAYVFAPDDILISEIVTEIEHEQLREAGNSQAKILILKPSNGDHQSKITPLNSAATKQREARLDVTPATPTKRREELLLREIEGHIRRFAFANRIEARQINTELFRHYGRPRRSMRFAELEKLLQYIMTTLSSGQDRARYWKSCAYSGTI